KIPMDRHACFHRRMTAWCFCLTVDLNWVYEEPTPVKRYTRRICRLLKARAAEKAIAVSLVAVASVLLSSCNRQETGKAVSEPASRIDVVSGNPIVIRTSAAEFRLFPSGYMQASLLSKGKDLGLDDPRIEDTG